MEERSRTVKDEEERKLLRPSVDVSTAVRLCNETWELSGGISIQEAGVVELDGYDDRNFLVRVGGGSGDAGDAGDARDARGGTKKGGKYVLKFHNGVESVRYASAIDAQVALLVYLRSRGLNVNEPLATRDGALVRRVDVPVHGGGTAPIAVRLLSFVEGRVMKEVTSQSDTLLEAAGRFVGEMDHLLDEFEHEGMRRPHLWDSRNALHLRQFLTCVTDETHRVMCERILTGFEKDVMPLAQQNKLRSGIIHGDANDTNLLIDHNDDSRIVGVIDFSDTLLSWRVCEISVSAAYAMYDICTRSSVSAHALDIDHTEKCMFFFSVPPSCHA